MREHQAGAHGCRGLSHSPALITFPWPWRCPPASQASREPWSLAEPAPCCGASPAQAALCSAEAGAGRDPVLQSSALFQQCPICWI